MDNNKQKIESAVSPVIGVLLMLVVTIIIAAVVSGFAGGLVTSQKKAPSMSGELMVKNTGEWGSGTNFYLKVLSTSEPIPTKDLKMTTLWNSSLGYSGGMTITGPNSTGTASSGTPSGKKVINDTPPLGFGPTIRNQTNAMSGSIPYGQWFGNYSLTSGTYMKAGATSSYGAQGAEKYTYCGPMGAWDPSQTDDITAVLGRNWTTLRVGDTVSVQIIHLPSGKVIFNQKTVVEG